jgi:hypothetical protein
MTAIDRSIKIGDMESYPAEFTQPGTGAGAPKRRAAQFHVSTKKL